MGFSFSPVRDVSSRLFGGDRTRKHKQVHDLLFVHDLSVSQLKPVSLLYIERRDIKRQYSKVRMIVKEK